MIKKRFLQFAAVALALAFAGCSDDKQVTPDVAENIADMVVYGTVYTVEDGTPEAEAFAVVQNAELACYPECSRKSRILNTSL